MPDEQKRGIFGSSRGNPNGAPRQSEDGATANAATTTSPSKSDSGVEATVSDQEADALQGAGGPNRTPAFTKRDFEDENTQLTDTDDLQSAKTGAAASSGRADIDLIGLEAAAAAGAKTPEGHEDTVQYTSTPIAALRIGPYQFENGVLRLHNDQVEDFEKLLKAGSIRTQQVVRKIDRSAGEAVARRYLEQNKSQSRSGVDTADRGPRAPTPGEGAPPKTEQ